MQIAGLQKLSLIDYPNKMVAVVFTLGCNFNCFYCHNRELIFPNKFPKENLIQEKEIFEFLGKRKGKLDGISITGGEPTMQKDLKEFIIKVKEMGFLVKLDSNGTNPEMLQDLINEKLVDYVAMDIKSPLNFEDYKRITKITNEKLFSKILESVKILRQEKVDFEFRTSLTRGLFSKDDIKRIIQDIKNNKIYYLQNFINPTEKLDENDKKIYNKLQPLKKEEIEEFRLVAEELGQKCIVRG
ncbi:anaerobic ribonucleoside-triphosphate reductase activating protein [Candidatus Falkowbacteria bacterium]|jgi:pyruvate formate lyase activating enzyme|nr:anaerobic ribonucleoside-triphosphate reductase activating protein [Candidatus Falkowbacteria bacterium]MBT4433354.1 anaerobic ribonucleoside-triphosphate reductase activating protein [Candidatus Falkowbacteria bacterium]